MRTMRNLTLVWLFAAGLSALVDGCIKQPTAPQEKGSGVGQCNPDMHQTCQGQHLAFNDPIDGPVALYKEGEHYTGLGDPYKRELSRDEAIRLAEARDEIAQIAAREGVSGKCY